LGGFFFEDHQWPDDFINPFPQFSDSTPTDVYSGCKLVLLRRGHVHQAKHLFRPKRCRPPTPTRLFSIPREGSPDVEIWLQDLDYKVVLAPSTDTDPPTSPIWSSDYVRASGLRLVAKDPDRLRLAQWGRGGHGGLCQHPAGLLLGLHQRDPVRLYDHGTRLDGGLDGGQCLDGGGGCSGPAGLSDPDQRHVPVITAT
jgi:hypothetical protein